MPETQSPLHPPQPGSLGDTYLRVHLPNESTTVIVVNSSMTMWEILNQISAKKELLPSQHTLKIVLSDGKEEIADLERLLGLYGNVDHVKVSKNSGTSKIPNIILNDAVNKTAKSISSKFKVISAPASRNQNTRVSPLEFPGGVEQNGRETDPPPTSSSAQKTKSRSVLLFKKSSTDVTTNESGQNHEITADNPGDKTLSEQNKPSYATSVTQSSGEESTSTDNQSVTSQGGLKPSASIRSSDGRSENWENGKHVSIQDSQSSLASSKFSIAPSESNMTLSRAALDKEERRRRAVSVASSHSGSVIRKSHHRNGRPRANTDSIMLVKAGESAADIAKETVVVITLPNFKTAYVRVPFENVMDDLLDFLCEKFNLDYEKFAFKLNDPKKPVVEMDRTISFFVKEEKVSEFFVAPGKKCYRVHYISEGDKDVMMLQVTMGKLQVMAGTREKLIDRLTIDAEGDDVAYMEVFLSTYRSFMPPDELFSQLLERFSATLPPEPSKEDIAYFAKMKVPSQKRVLAVFKAWVENHWHDFAISSELRMSLEDACDFFEEAESGKFKAEAEGLKRAAKKQEEQYEEKYSFYKTVERKSKTMESMIAELSPEVLAEQLCIHNFKLFSNIHPIEFLHQIWRKDSSDTETTPYLNFFIERFDKEYYWVATEILNQKDLKKRAAILKTIILAAKACLERNNFFSTFSLSAGLSLGPVSRLKKTWELMSDKVKAIHAELEKAIDPSRNMKNYKDLLAAAKAPIIPFLPIYLKDLTFINDGNQSILEGMVNFDKLRMMANRVKDITSLATVGYSFEPNPAFQNYIAKPPFEKNLSKLKEMSLECEK